MELKASKDIEIRFSEVDSMNVVWHGSYALYFEDARETSVHNMGWNILRLPETAISHRL